MSDDAVEGEEAAAGSAGDAVAKPGEGVMLACGGRVEHAVKRIAKNTSERLMNVERRRPAGVTAQNRT